MILSWHYLACSSNIICLAISFCESVNFCVYLVKKSSYYLPKNLPRAQIIHAQTSSLAGLRYPASNTRLVDETRCGTPIADPCPVSSDNLFTLILGG